MHLGGNPPNPVGGQAMPGGNVGQPLPPMSGAPLPPAIAPARSTVNQGMPPMSGPLVSNVMNQGQAPATRPMPVQQPMIQQLTRALAPQMSRFNRQF